MTYDEQSSMFDLFVQKQKDLMFKKGNDYASEDRLSNFKKVGAISLVTPEQTILQLLATKIVRLGNLVQPGKVPNNESVEDSLIDLANYAFLMYAVLNENTEVLAVAVKPVDITDGVTDETVTQEQSSTNNPVVPEKTLADAGIVVLTGGANIAGNVNGAPITASNVPTDVSAPSTLTASKEITDVIDENDGVTIIDTPVVVSPTPEVPSA